MGIKIDNEFRTVWFVGKDWPQFEVRPGYCRNRDGAPAIFCAATDGIRTWCITVERWLDERRTGGIVRLPT